MERAWDPAFLWRGVSHHSQSHHAEDQHAGLEQGSLGEVAAQPPNDQALDELGEGERAEVGTAGPGRASGLWLTWGPPLLPITPGPLTPAPAATRHRAEGRACNSQDGPKVLGRRGLQPGGLTHMHTHACTHMHPPTHIHVPHPEIIACLLFQV